MALVAWNRSRTLDVRNYPMCAWERVLAWWRPANGHELKIGFPMLFD